MSARWLVFVCVLGPALVRAETPRPESLAGWTTYVTATERRIQRELNSAQGFLAQDFGPAASADRRQVMSGGLVVQKMRAAGDRAQAIDVPGALVHHWRGAVLIPGRTATEVLADLLNGPPDTEDVQQSAVLERGPDRMRVYLRVQRSRLVTVVYNTEHVVTFTRFGTGRASSASTATKIAELEAPGTPRERELPPGDDRGFLWRWNAYWRYEDVDGGVVAECESVSLSRDVPFVLRWLVSPLVERTARESMERTLRALRAHFG